MTMAKKTKDEVIEELRRPLVYCMQSGDRYVLFLDKLAIDFKEKFNDEANFPTNKIFNFEDWRNPTNYKKILKSGEDKDTFGN